MSVHCLIYMESHWDSYKSFLGFVLKKFCCSLHRHKHNVSVRWYLFCFSLPLGVTVQFYVVGCISLKTCSKKRLYENMVIQCFVKKEHWPKVKENPFELLTIANKLFVAELEYFTGGVFSNVNLLKLNTRLHYIFYHINNGSSFCASTKSTLMHIMLSVLKETS